MSENNYFGSICFLLMLIVMAVFGADAVAIWTMLILLLLIPISLGGALICAPRLTGKLDAPAVSEVGKNNIIKVSVANRSYFPYFRLGTVLRAQNRFTGRSSDFRKALFVNFMGKNGFELQIIPEQIGRYDLNLEKLCIYDCWGLIPLFRKQTVTATFLVLPDLFFPNVILTKNGVIEPECDTFSPYKSGNDPAETFGIREYEPGDYISRIHWKLTGKFDVPVIREAGLPVNESVLILVELAVPKDKISPSSAVCHSIGEIALSLSHRLLDMGYGHTLVWQNGNTEGLTEFGINQEESFPELADALLSSSPVFGSEDTVMAYQKAYAQCPYSNIVYISSFCSACLSLLSVTGRKTQIICSEQEQQGSSDTFYYCTTPETYETDLGEILI